MNRIFLSGNLTRNPETRFMSDGTAVSNFGLAVNERWTDRETGEPRETRLLCRDRGLGTAG